MYFKRILALIIDLIILFFIFKLTAYISINCSNCIVSINFLISLLYFSIFNSKLGSGKTIGKKIFKLVVLNKFLGYLQFKHAFIRSFMMTFPFFLLNLDIDYLISNKREYELYFKALSFLTIPYISGIIIFSIFDSPLHRGMHDIIGQSVVVKDNYNFQAFPLNKKKIYVVYGITVLILSIITTLLFLANSRNKFPEANDIILNKILLVTKKYPNIVTAQIDSNPTIIYLKINIPINNFYKYIPFLLRDMREFKDNNIDLYNCKIDITYVTKDIHVYYDSIRYTKTNKIENLEYDCNHF